MSKNKLMLATVIGLVGMCSIGSLDAAKKNKKDKGTKGSKTAISKFAVMDVNKDGFLDLEEFLKKIPKTKKKEFEAKYKSSDTDGDEKLNKEEFVLKYKELIPPKNKKKKTK
ncbi:MAG: hypothetical protein HQL32_15130 [Planctomycetes bacterium]|nr:hypothetical protein [Planctomycetota bacterium]